MDKKIKQMMADLSSPEEMSTDDHIALQIEDSTDDESVSQNDTSQSDLQMSVVNDDCQWKEKSIDDLQHDFGKWGPHPSPNVIPSKSHTVLIRLPVKHGKVPSPFPSHQQDKWDQDHVKMPFSTSNLYPVVEEDGESSLRLRWELINEALLNNITSSKQIEAAIFSYNSRYNEKWNFNALHAFLNEVLVEDEAETFFNTIFPGIVQLALQLPDLVTGPLPLLRRECCRAVTLSQLQIASLLANAFLCTFPRRNSTKRGSEYETYPDINFNRLFQCRNTESTPFIMEKFKCIFNYFRRVSSQTPTGVVTFARRFIRPEMLPQWSRSPNTLPDLYVTSTGTIEGDGTGMLQVDFANKFIGGGVLGWGCVQEEIRFLICPELLVSRLFTEALEPCEALVIVGCEQFNAYTGYSDTFEWVGNFIDPTERDSFGRKKTSIVAIDALMFGHSREQYTVKCISRELNKAYVGFHDPDWSTDSSRKNIPLPAVASGNWGCGAFRGDAELKALIQLMAAAEANRSMAYFTFSNKPLRDRIFDVHKYLTDRNVTVGRLWQVLCQYCTEVEGNRQSRPDLYQYLYQVVDTPTPKCAEPSTYRQLSVSKQSKENRPQPTHSELEKSVLADAGYPAEFLDALMENISGEEYSAHSQTRNSDGNSQEELNPPNKNSDEESNGLTTSEYFTPKPSSSCNDSVRNLNNSSSSRKSVLSLLEEEERVGANLAMDTRTDVLNSERSVIENTSESKISESDDLNVKRPKWPKPTSTKRKISDYFSSVQS